MRRVLLVFVVLAAAASSLLIYNNTVGQKSAYLSAVAYCPPEQVADWSCYWCAKLPSVRVLGAWWDERTSTYAYVAFDREYDSHLLSFEGTQDLTDWMNDLEASKLAPYKDHPEARVHYGFWKAYSSVRAELLDFVAASGVERVFVTGHSLGSALATLAALDIAEEFALQDVTMIGLGGPRVGNAAYAQLFAANVRAYYRMTHGKDPVVHLPPRWMGFYHVGNEVFYPNKSTEYRTCSSGEDPACADGEPFAPWDVADHLYYMGYRIGHCSA